ncbi:MAG: oxidoreductase [Gordonia sp. (in: high G+C Gram-positive bacteria)]
MSSDPLAPLVQLPGVAAAAQEARDAVIAVHRHPANLRGWDKTATEASWRAGRSSAAIDGGSVELRRDGDFDDPVLSGAMRVAQALDGDSLEQLTVVFRRAPAQAFARLHVLAAVDLVADPDTLGRPRSGAEVAARLDLLGQLITGASSAPAPVLAAVVHGELLSLDAFGVASGVVARAASRLTCTVTGLDPHNLGVPEVTWLKRVDDYRRLSAAFGTGDPDALREWIMFCCNAFVAGAAEARSIADAAHSG